MGTDISFLITFCCYNKYLSRSALKVDRNLITDDCVKYPMESDSLELLTSFLPDHLLFLGQIVNVEPLFDVVVVKNSHE